MKKKDIFTQAAEEKRRDFYYKPGEDGHGLYAVPINTEDIFNLSEEQLQELKIKHETIQKKLDTKPLSEMSYSESLEVLITDGWGLDDINYLRSFLHHLKEKGWL